jgi:hypothetical protein
VDLFYGISIFTAKVFLLPWLLPSAGVTLSVPVNASIPHSGSDFNITRQMAARLLFWVLWLTTAGYPQNECSPWPKP